MNSFQFRLQMNSLDCQGIWIGDFPAGADMLMTIETMEETVDATSCTMSQVVNVTNVLGLLQVLAGHDRF